MQTLSDETIREALSQRTVTLPDGTRIPALGQGTWNMGDNPARREEEVQALRLGIELGMTVVDTAEMYGEGLSESLVGEAIKGKRDEVFLVSKVYPHNAGGERLARSCEASLQRLGTDHLDLYLLHWRGSIPLAETVQGMEQLVAEGKIRRWGVSNLDTSDMQELWKVPGGEACAVNQVLYHIASRGIEYELQPWLQQQRIPMMAYSPLAQGGSMRKGMLENKVVQSIAKEYQVSPSQLILAWTIRKSGVLSIPKASSSDHVRENAAAASIDLREDTLAQLEEAFPAPKRKVPLDII
ncbi:aldo/keto reductase [Paenibacillus daejeonensis]|uniref:aldo/keto reductase n=1 Tax=Paenibacillus daejeonensis TaxID=135193 RepID=UPI00037B8AD7|nr:aldo/keto reductase [Paenibacillus daejeonensis]